MTPRNALILFIAVSMCGCAGSMKPASMQTPPTRLLQINDVEWVDLSDVKEIIFFRNDPSSSEPFVIAMWHRGATDNPFKFTFTDPTEAYDAWKRLTARLGGSLKESDWIPTPAAPKLPAATEPLSAPPQTLFTNHAETTNFTVFRDDLNQLAACRDEKLITPEEYQRGHDRKVADFVASSANGNGYQAQFSQMHSDLKELETSRADHLLTDDQIVTMHKGIVSRYISAPE